MIDIHAHILPNCDDGAYSYTEAIRIIESAAEAGTKIFAATPHCNIMGGYHTKPVDIVRKILKLQSAVDESGLKVKIMPGMEILYSPHIAEKLKAGELITLNGTKYPLVEFDFNEEAEIILGAAERLLDAGYIPVIAHPERYECFYRNIDGVYALYRMGAVIQVNKGSVMGSFGGKVWEVADALLRHRLAAVAASDAHSSSYRNADLSEFADLLDAEYGVDCSRLLLDINPRNILQDKPVVWNDPIPFR